MTPTEEIKQKIDVVDLVSEYVQLRQAGANWKGLCPFHNEKSPSFMVSREKQIWHCFGCSEGGDIFSFIQKYEGLDFPEALKLLADKAGVRLPTFEGKGDSRKALLQDINRFAAELFYKVLMDTSQGKAAHAYVLRRGLTDDTIREFKIGFSPDSWDFTVGMLRKKGFRDEDIVAAGLAVRNARGGIYDRFRGRVMYPITTVTGTVVGFTARILDDTKKDQGGKYINTPQTQLYNKSVILFGLDKAKSAIKKRDLAVIVEGNMDVIASHQAGIKNVIASSGTALTLEQLQIIKRYTNNIALAFDMDIAGQAAAEKGIANALSLGMDVKVIELPYTAGGTQRFKDPDECIKTNPALWQAAIDNAKGIMSFYFDRTFSLFDKSLPEGKKKIAADLLPHILKLESVVERDSWLSTLARKLDTPETIIREVVARIEEGKQVSKKYLVSSSKTKTIEVLKPRQYQLAEHFLAIIIKEPAMIAQAIESIDPEMIVDKELQALYKEIISSYNETTHFDIVSLESLLKDSQNNLLETLNTLQLLADKDFFNFTRDELEKELIVIINNLQHFYISYKVSEIQNSIQKAEEQGNAALIQELSRQFSQYAEKLNRLKHI